MSFILTFTVLFVILIILQNFFARSLFSLLFLLTKSPLMATRLFSLIMLPGTILHELSHWLVAEILQVPTGMFDYIPKVEGNNIRMGSLQIANTDPFRRTLVGIAPMITGLCTIVLLTNLLPNDVRFIFNDRTTIDIRDMISSWTTFVYPLYNILIIWFIFLISNTMFSSWKDLEAVVVPAIMGIFAVLVWWKMGLPGMEQLLSAISPLMIKLNSALMLVITIDSIVIGLVKLITTISGKILHRKIVKRLG